MTVKCTVLYFRLRGMFTARLGAMVPLLLALKIGKAGFVGWNFLLVASVFSRIRAKSDIYSWFWE